MSIPWAVDPIPQDQPAQLHLSEGEDQWLGDSKRAPKAAGRKAKRGGPECTDTNVQPLLDGAGCIHKEKPEGTGWMFLAIGGGKRRRLTPEEISTPYRKWPKAKFVRLRRTARPGLSFESRVRPLLFLESVQLHKTYGAVMVAELKGQFSARSARLMWESAARARQTVWFKTLAHQGLHDPKPGYSMAVAGEKLRPFHAAGAQTAVACHGYPVPSDVAAWAQFVDAFWGDNSAAFRKAANR